MAQADRSLNEMCEIVDPRLLCIENLEDPLRMYAADVFTTGASLAGLPALALPSGVAEEGLPYSIQLVGAPFAEPVVFDLGRRLEEVLEVPRLQEQVLQLDLPSEDRT